MPLRGDVDDELKLTPREVTQLEAAMNKAPQVYMEGWTTTAELGGLYKLAVQRADAMEIAGESLRLLARNDKLLTLAERMRIRELAEQLSKLD